MSLSALLPPVPAAFALVLLAACAGPGPEGGEGTPARAASEQWVTTAQEGIAAGEYAARADGTRLRVTNRAQDLRGSFDAEGLTLTTRAGTGQVSWSLSGWGRDGALVAAQAVVPEPGACVAGGQIDAFGACLRRVEYARPGLVEWWENRAEGLEQGFTVTAPPDGAGPLVFDLALTGASADLDGDDVLLVREGDAPLRVSKLAAWDQSGRVLPAGFEVTEAGLRIVVDDTGATGTITVDPLLTTAGWAEDSDQATSYYGYSVASAGDVNGDGFGDVVIGAYLYDNGATDEGRAYVYLGAPSGLATTAAWTGEANQAFAHFGWSVASAGDVNGDGYGDLIVGADLYDNGSANEGRAYVYLGSASGLATSSAWTAESDQAGARMGISVASAGDTNGDGYSEVIVGAHLYANGSTAEGRASVYLGSSSGLATSAAWTSESNQASAWFGWSVASAGDVNGDGYGDVAVGAHLYDNGSTDEGRVTVFHGSASGLSTTSSWSGESDLASAYFGYSTASAGDVNGDGYGDLVVGAYAYDNGSTDEGQASVYLGSSTGLASTATWTAESDQASAYFGWSVAGAGDINGDGYSDVIVGAYAYDNGSTDEGAAFAFYGSSAGLAATAGWSAESGQAAGYAGFSVASAGDVDGDGFGDVLVGAYAYDNGSADEGYVSLYPGSGAGLGTASAWTGESGQTSGYAGASVASAGDTNGDGYGDVIVGAYGYDNGSTDEGIAYVYLGTATGVATTAAWTAEGNQAQAYFGAAVASAGDVNGDGYGDVIVGAYSYDDGSSNEGSAFVFLGSSSGLATSAAWSAQPDQTSAHFGTTVAAAGDVNGDGYGDVVVGAPDYDNGSTDEGRAYVYYGSVSGLATTAAWTAEPDQASANFGASVATAGDVDGDGYADVIVGADGYDNGSTDEGAAFVYLGSVAGLATSAAWTAESGQTLAGFGTSVASAGDVDGDGYSDVIIGADGYDNGSTDEGAAFVYLGSVSGLATTSAWSAESGQASAYFGAAVSSAGDLDGDGYADVIVGSAYYDNGSSNEGRASVYMGSSAGLATTASWTAEADQNFAYFGTSVAAAGDVNGDGFGDLIVGAFLYDNGTTNEGQAAVYLGNGADGAVPLARVGQARQSGASTPISAGLSSSSASAFDVAMTTARGPWGRSRVKLQIEVKDLGTAFDGTGLVTSVTSVSSGLTGVAIDEAITGLDAGTGYHWRARVVALPAEGRTQGWGSWFLGGRSGESMAGHVFTLGDTVYADADGDGDGNAFAPAISRGSASAGYVATGTDCDDTVSTVYPGAAEVTADGVDQDCDSVDTCYTDGDGDDYGTAALVDGSSLSCVSGSGAPVNTDCNDADASVNPAGTETVADGVDQDCDGVESCYTDADGDNTGTSVVTDGSSLSCSTGAGASTADDCDDGSATVYPGAFETVADGIDQDCDGVDACYTDADGDNYGTLTIVGGSSLDCLSGTGASTATDCDDTDAGVNTGGTEVVADGIDQDCDDVDACYTDDDGDGYGTSAVVDGSSKDCVSGSGAASATDCDDAVAAVNPAATEACDAANTDEDCDGLADDLDASPSGTTAFVIDQDGDGYTGSATVDACDDPATTTLHGAGDCDETRAEVHPGAEESDCADPIDYNCDGSVGSEDADGDGFTACTECDDAAASVYPGAAETDCAGTVDYNCDGSVGSEDVDGDGYTACEDCDDNQAGANPDATEVAGDEIDGDCDGAELCLADADDDGYTADAPATVVSADLYCDGAGEASDLDPAGDCDDTSTFYAPGASEDDCADPNDYNCDGSVGYADSDADGFPACEECSDSNAAVNPSATEVCNGLDDDCEGTVDVGATDAPTWYADADQDGYTDPAVSLVACAAPEGYAAATEDDCNDADGAISPGGLDLIGDGIDQDCDGVDAGAGDGADTGDDSGDGEGKDDECQCGTGGSTVGWALLVGALAVGMRRRRG
ncbi:MAG: hypothetical protein EXR71_05430 [Myxococcales bacterium]|nr:hypothetical protein [Myxococcales bacterium]